LAPGSAGFPPPKRLRASRDFGRVFAQPARASDRFFTVLARPNDAGLARLGLAISRKVAKRAVDRNRLKRIARETFRKQSLPALDFVILARGDAAAAPSHVLAESLAAHFARLSRPKRPRVDEGSRAADRSAPHSGPVDRSSDETHG
jgi:ribonuclease P protein component